MRARFAFVACAALLTATTAQAADAPVQKMDTTMGSVLANPEGMTLYTYAKDQPGQSACVDACAANWPPLMADADATGSGDYSVIDRPDGGKQWAYKGQPLYLWVRDKQPGDTTGAGMANGAWEVAKP
ncbi:hypothetical protein ACM64Y_15710 [Novispirillum sp. DQ9]|uniref:COG4315 family predicted lipoprotein n=1 Tax=Novispirillum sp. DQ9 TaxID=3398612 RepID=UPI003C7D0069